MKMSKTITVEKITFDTIDEIARTRNIPFNAAVDLIVKYYLDDNKPVEYEIVTCKNCGGRYSNRLPNCPSCTLPDPSTSG